MFLVQDQVRTVKWEIFQNSDLSVGNRWMIRGWIQGGWRQVGGRSEPSRRQDGDRSEEFQLNGYSIEM